MNSLTICRVDVLTHTCRYAVVFLIGYRLSKFLLSLKSQHLLGFLCTPHLSYPEEMCNGTWFSGKPTKNTFKHTQVLWGISTPSMTNLALKIGKISKSSEFLYVFLRNSEMFEIFPILKARLVILGVEIPPKDLGVFECVFSGLSGKPGPIAYLLRV